ncbi:glycerol kinase GlpK [Thiohalorhabdus sp.]|uniref:glycerol kinase GlpK n=1 Tax=Thiohalorhabdus sp. TaxID=3094134 RepID=UPI002FC33AE4
MAEAVLAIDQGTTGSTALVFDHQGGVRGRGYSELPQSYPNPGWVEHDPEAIWGTSLEVMTAALADAGLAAADLAAIGITNQRETTVVWDRATGEPVHPAIVWQSRQTAELCDRLRADGWEPLFRERTGLLLDAYFSGTKIRWILDRYPEARRKAEQGEVLFGTVDSWMLWRFTGGAVHATEPTNASRTLLFNIHQRCWDSGLLEVLDIPEAMLPEVRTSAGRFGETAAIDGLAPGIPVAGMAGDQQAALYAQQCWQPGEAKNTYGTGSFVLMNMGDAHPISENGLLTTLCCDAFGGPAYALEGAIFVTGASVQWLRDGLGIIESAAETEALARELAGNDGVYLVPAFAGLGAPYWDMGARGTLVGMTRGTGRAHLARAALEAMAYQTRDVVEAMNRDSATPIAELRVDGGGANNDWLLQFQADQLGVAVERPRQVETTAAGSAFLAGLAEGFWSHPEEMRQARERDRLFAPTMDASERDRLYSGWRDAVVRSRSGE